MWKVLHALFGWDYVAVSFGGDTYIRRVHKTSLEDRYFTIYGSMVFLDDSWDFHRWKPLTWKEEDEQNSGENS